MLLKQRRRECQDPLSRCRRPWSSENPKVIRLVPRLYLASERGGGGGKGRNPRQLLTGGGTGRLIWQREASRFARLEAEEEEEGWWGQRGVEEESGGSGAKWFKLSRGGRLRLGWHKDRSASVKGGCKKVRAVGLRWLHAPCDGRLFIWLSAVRESQSTCAPERLPV